MRKAISVLLVILLLVNLFGFYTAFYITRAGVKADMKELLAHSDIGKLQRFDLSSSQFNALSNPEGDYSEVEINHHMYDVKKVEQHEGKVVLFALEDDGETDLLDKIVKYIKDSSASGKSSPNTLVKLLQQEFTGYESIIDIDLPVSVCALTEPQFKLVSIPRLTSTPPPDGSPIS